MSDEMNKTTTIPLSKKMKELLHEEGRMREQWNDLVFRLINELRMWRQLHDIYRWDCGNIYTLRSNIYLLKQRLSTYNPDMCLNDILNSNWIPSHDCPDDFVEIFRERILTIDRANMCLVWMPGDDLEVFTFDQIRNGEHQIELESRPFSDTVNTEEEK